jgi:DNA (cytosine-5)-methyltransferase 1
MANLLCEHWELFSETWQTSGWMRNGQVFELPMQVHRTTASEFSSLPTPKARDSQPEGYEAGLRRATPQVGTIVKGIADGDPRVQELLRTPAASEAERGHQPEDKSKARGGQVTLSGQMMTYFPTPKALDGVKGSLKTSAQREADGRQVDLPNVARDLLPTTRTSMKNGATAKEVAAGNPKFRLEAVTNWGKFEPAIKRWEETLGRPAPAPTKPDGKDGGHRLSSAFTEWMMGVPEGWITDCGLSRNDELKACGNGVVPQQAELALRVLLEGITLPAGGASESSNSNS